MDDLVQEFLEETNEALARLDSDLVRLEADPSDRTCLDGVFRLMHTVKGTSGFMNLVRLESVAHAAENVLSKVRDGELEIDSAMVTAVLGAVDRIGQITRDWSESGAEPQGDDSDVLDRLKAAASGDAAAEPVAEETPDDGDSAGLPPELAELTLEDLPAEPAREVKDGEVSLEELERIFQETEVDAAEPEPQDAEFEPEAPGPETAPVAQADGDDAEIIVLDDADAAPALADSEPDEPIADAAPAPEPEPAAEAAPNAPADMAREIESRLGAAPADASKPGEAKTAGDTGRGAVVSQNIRVNVELLENLMTMVGELVLSRNQLLQMVRADADSEYNQPLQRLSRITSDLQEGVMKARMQPIGNAWQTLPRVVRDLSNELGKKAVLTMDGEETELDRQVLELIKDPLTHMVRNAVDHGLETPEIRQANGKPAAGSVTLTARHEGGHIVIELSDDGKGLDFDRIREKALEKGVADAEALQGMTQQQLGRLIFHPGFSTAAKVTNVSGRGVGMDVVKTNIEKIGGAVDITSKPGHGSTFEIKIPLTLAIVSALIIEAGHERFAIPQICVQELVRATPDSEHRIEWVEKAPLLRLRGNLLPLLFLDESLGLRGEDEPASADRREAFVVVLQSGSFRFGVVVDRVFDTEEIVVKPVAGILRDLTMFSGNTILGDGSVVMILDPNGLSSQAADVDAHAEADGDEAMAEDDDLLTLLVFQAGGEEPRAVPLSLIERLEEFKADQVERSSGHPMVKYRDTLMPLMTLDGQRIGERASLPVIVFMDDGKAVGLVVDKILDIVDETLELKLSSQTAGLLGSAVVAGKATDILDVGHFVETANKTFFSGKGAERKSRYALKKRVLFAEDSGFFRNLVKPLLEQAGFDVTVEETGDAAFARLERGEEFDIIVSDIEMPGMSGFEFAEAVRRRPELALTPMIALTNCYSEQDIKRGREAGFTDYVRKIDHDSLSAALNKAMKLAESNQKEAA